MKFTVHYTPDQRTDPLIDPDHIVALAADEYGLTVQWQLTANIDVVEFEATGQHDEIEAGRLLKRLAVHNLHVTGPDGIRVEAS